MESNKNHLQQKFDEIKKRIIQDENLRHLVFNFDDTIENNLEYEFLGTKDNYLKYFFNVLVLTTFICFKSYLDWQKSNEINNEKNKIDNYSNSMIRIINLFKSCYSTKDINLDLIENLMINLQVDDSSNDVGFIKALKLGNFINFKDAQISISKCIYYLKLDRLSSRKELNFTFENLIQVFKIFPFLSQLDVKFSDYYNGYYKVKLFYESKLFLDLEDLIIVDSLDSCYYLEDIQLEDPRTFSGNSNKKDQILTLNFIDFRYGDLIKFYYLDSPINEREFDGIIVDKYSTAIEDIIIRYDAYSSIIDNDESYFFQDYMFFNNQYIKNLALVISDVLGLDTRKSIFEKFKDKYQNVFEKLKVHSLYGNQTIMSYRWDELIIFLLLEEGIYEILSFILQTEKYSAIISEFIVMFGDKAAAIKENNDIILMAEHEYDNKEAQVKAIIFFATKLLAVDEMNLSKGFTPITIKDIIKEFRKIYENNKLTRTEKILLLINKIMTTVLFLDSFYNGIIEYALKKKYLELIWEDSYINFKNSQSEWQKAFSEKTNDIKKEQMKFYTTLSKFENSNYTSKELYDFLSLFFKRLLLLNEIISKEKKEAFFNSFGKRVLFNVKDMEYCQNVILNTLIDPIDLKALFNAGTNFFIYLDRGVLGSNKSHIEDSIYPLIGTYSHEVYTRDGYHYSYMNIINIQDEMNHFEYKPVRIKIISDEKFEFGRMYYCIPNINRVACVNKQSDNNLKIDREYIWISPIIIPCDFFSKFSQIQIQPLKNEADFLEAAELLYQTDEKIYGGLFGTLKNAKKVIPVLFSGKLDDQHDHNLFYKDNFYIAKLDNKVVAISSYYSSFPNIMDTHNFLNSAFDYLNIETPASLDRAYEYFLDTFKDSIGNNGVICDFCVRKDYRSQGIGKYFLSELLRKFIKDKDILISVYADNIIAINLYRSLGFIPFANDYDNRGIKLSNTELYFKMIKYM